ncbi:uncharacterized protein LOC114517359 [Dendronephthya gigantea]|uniref:uncharacterized protein LOC114517359 n=1 Tax=Dendronephthya gigantea TaxID=151771 RepID=UPI00106BAD09|nr:uncharacterized protein LOC114517359 [Dendronephthya gigantea]
MKIVAIATAFPPIVVLLVGTGLVGNLLKEFRDLSETDNAYDRGAFGRFEFYLFSSCLGVIISILSLVGAATGIVGNKGGALAMASVHALWALQLLVSSALNAKVVAEFEGEEERGFGRETKSTCEHWEESKSDLNCNHLIGGVVCGFIGAVIFIVNTVVYLLWAKQSTE